MNSCNTVNHKSVRSVSYVPQILIQIELLFKLHRICANLCQLLLQMPENKFELLETDQTELKKIKDGGYKKTRQQKLGVFNDFSMPRKEYRHHRKKSGGNV